MNSLFFCFFSSFVLSFFTKHTHKQEDGCLPHFQLLCASSHLTDFASDTKVEEPMTNLPNPDQVGTLLFLCLSFFFLIS